MVKPVQVLVVAYPVNSRFAPPIPNPLATLMFPIVFPSGMKTAPGEFSGGRFTW